MIRPRLLNKEEQKFNDRLWELRLKYNDIDAFDKDIDDIIMGTGTEEFARITKQFKTPAEYAKALAIMSQYINSGEEVPEEVWKRVSQTRKNFSESIKKAGVIYRE